MSWETQIADRRIHGTTNHDWCQHTSCEVAKLLIANGAEINVPDKSGRTPLHMAARGGGTPSARLLLENGADIRAREDNGYTALHGAADLGRVEVAAFLIERGIDVNARDKEGRTAIGVALTRRDNREKMVELLREHGGIE